MGFRRQCHQRVKGSAPLLFKERGSSRSRSEWGDSCGSFAENVRGDLLEGEGLSSWGQREIKKDGKIPVSDRAEDDGSAVKGTEKRGTELRGGRKGCLLRVDLVKVTQCWGDVDSQHKRRSESFERRTDHKAEKMGKACRGGSVERYHGRTENAILSSIAVTQKSKSLV